MIDTLTQYLSWVSIFLAIIGISLISFDVIPRQIAALRVVDEYSYERRRLPVLASSFLLLALLVGAAITYNTLTGKHGADAYTNMTRTLVNLMIFHGGFTWASLYKRRSQ